MTPNAALNVVLGGHGAHCDSWQPNCPRCKKEDEAVKVLRSLIAEVEGDNGLRASAAAGWALANARLEELNKRTTELPFHLFGDHSVQFVRIAANDGSWVRLASPEEKKMAEALGLLPPKGE